MSNLEDISVRIQAREPEASSEQVLAVLSEIRSRLERLIAEGKAHSIDLRSLPLPPADYEALADGLGTGEIRASMHALGPSTVCETSVPGVWWITHRNSDDEIVAEFIEITHCPEILATPREDLAQGIQRLDALLSQPQEAHHNGGDEP